GGTNQAEMQELVFAQRPGADMRPYDRLIGAALDGKRGLFARQDTVEAAWRVVDPILGDAVPLHTYPRGSWGPKEADRLLPEGVTSADPGRCGSRGGAGAVPARRLLRLAPAARRSIALTAALSVGAAVLVVTQAGLLAAVVADAFLHGAGLARLAPML